MNRTTILNTVLIATALMLVGTTAQADLVAHYRLDETGGTTAADATGSHNAEYSGSPALGQPGAAPGTGTSVLFDGVDDKVFNVTPRLPSDLLELTLSTWVNLDDSQYGAIFGIGENRPWLLWHNPGAVGEELRWISHLANDMAANPPYGEWFHVAITSSDIADTSRMYINGVQVNENTDITNFVDEPDQIFGIGYRPGHSGIPDPSDPPVPLHLKGGIDDVQIYERVLTADQVASLFNDPGSVVPDLVPGDFNSDGTIDSLDANILADNLNGHLDGDVDFSKGDIDLDFDVDLDDFIQFREIFLQQPPLAAGTGVPEPSSVALLLAALTGVAAVARRRNHRVR